MNNQISTTSSEVSHKEQNQIILYRPNDTISLEVRLENETVWLTQAQIAELFERDRTVIGKHIKNCYKEGELDQNIICANFAHTTLYIARVNNKKSTDLVANATSYDTTTTFSFKINLIL